MPYDVMLITIVGLPFAASLAALFMRANARNLAAWLATGVALATLLLAVLLYPSITGGGVVHHVISWVPSLGLNLTLRVDGFTWLFLMLICGIGALVGIYARYYMSPDDPVPRFFSFLLAFMGSMLGIVMAGNVIQLVFFWELTSLFSFLLIGYWHHGTAAREGARMALIVTSAGGLCLLAGMLVVGRIVGSYDLDVILASGDLIRTHWLYEPALVLILLGAFTKSAQFPFHFWLPHAMSAPTPVSAYLHSATMVKAGVFLLVRFWPVLSGTPEWFWLVGTAGLVTLVLGAYFAMFQQDLKGILAYSTISHLGLITLLLGMGSPLACVAAIFHIVNHATFKASLFMAAGAIDHEAGTRDLRRLGGLRRFMPVTATLAIIASAAMAGVPLLNGFLSKEMFFEETLVAHWGSALDLVPTLAAVIASAFGVTYALRLVVGVFFGPVPESLPRQPHEPPRWMLLPIGFLVAACILVGMFPTPVIGPLLHAASVSVLGAQTPSYSLAVWHGFTPALLMSVVTLAAGTLLYLTRRRWMARQDRAPLTGGLSGKAIFERLLRLLAKTAPRRLERGFPSQRLQPQILMIILAALLAAALAVGGSPAALEPLRWSSIDPAFALLWVLGGACAAGAAVLAKFHRLAALILTGGAGLVSCISFVWLSAPDLAATQLLVEVVTTILILLGLRWLPRRIEVQTPASDRLARFRRRRDAVIAIAAGLGLATLAYGVMMHPVENSISRFFLERAYSEGGGRNVVNVLLVDFRAFDTLGEITVLAIVALTVFALLRRFRPSAESVGAPAQQRYQNAADEQAPDRSAGHTLTSYLMIPGLIIQLMFPVILLFGLHLFLRGHDLPGGGFAAGITISVGLILLYMAGGARWVESRLRVAPVRWIGLGLLTATGTGLGSLLFGYPFLTAYFRYLDLPVFGRIPLATAVLFDLGVLMLVVGATSLILIALAHQSLRRPRLAAPSADTRPSEPAGER
ncbi:MAG: monovalent cation/H+ antiporter subunit A [Phenylobacterium sp.]|uniref:monovalent cation/H+ antiporter subunit A n=1 Tax=Phenylobacterium sp. TaxID=1871053 RepID=UPI0027230AC6|nr:monovalent cation/H+ antiporter subunit A [Phenylobacterium sp.]MDO9432324.1 monovalent cation/H+ antiporter subunit A [Phenylobacterium sp.]